MSDEKLKILYIAGAGRSGSTILHNILGQINGFVAVGELRYIWERGLIHNRLCGCGMPFRSCEQWQTVMRQAFGGLDQVDAHKLFNQIEHFRMHHLPLTVLPSIREKQLSRLDGYLESLTKLYRAIQSVTGCQVIVDSSKNPSYGYLLRLIPHFDFYVLHFIRDSRAAAYSWSLLKAFQPDPADPDYMTQKTMINSSFQWNTRNLAAELILYPGSAQHLLMRYEDFVRAPQGAVSQITNMVGVPARNSPFVDADTVNLETTIHSVFGNLVRFQTGLVKLRSDERWRTQMKPRDKLTVTGLTWPLLLKYGYMKPAVKAKYDQLQS